jgi:hypothetical protein
MIKHGNEKVTITSGEPPKRSRACEGAKVSAEEQQWLALVQERHGGDPNADACDGSCVAQVAWL